MNILLAGMSGTGTGTSTVLPELACRGWFVVDTDHGAWKLPGPGGEPE